MRGQEDRNRGRGNGVVDKKSLQLKGGGEKRVTLSIIVREGIGAGSRPKCS
jgi:hypothetical protein